MIKTRDELASALREAAELEHGLLLQYLFAALSLERDIGSGIAARHAELARLWAGAILTIARDEMAHLGTVCNMLSAIGEAPHFTRPNFPQPKGRYYPFRFSLERFSAKALYEFLRFEQPEGVNLPPPPHASLLKATAPKYEYVGELYRKIAEGFATIDEKSLFIGPRFAQDAHNWSNPGRFRLFPVIDRASAAAAIDFIVQQGEGTPQNREGSHYNTFLTIYNAFQTEGFPDAVSCKVVANPRTRDSEDAPGQGTMLTDARSVEVAKLFNDVYATSLQTLAQYYSYGGETSKQRECLQLVSRSLMGCAMRPIAEELMTLPASHPATDAKAGPPFELLGPITLPAFVPNRWVTLIEQLESAATHAEALAHSLPRLKHIGENLRIMRIRVERASREGVA